VVEKWNTGFDLRFAFAIEVKPQRYPGFERIAFNVGLPFHW
jgi:hypothetical protein